MCVCRIDEVREFKKCQKRMCGIVYNFEKLMKNSVSLSLKKNSSFFISSTEKKVVLSEIPTTHRSRSEINIYTFTRYTHEYKKERQKDHGEIFDHHFVEFTYDSGAIIASQCRHQPGCMRRVDETLQGTQGSVNTGKGRIMDLEGNEMYKYLSLIHI